MNPAMKCQMPSEETLRRCMRNTTAHCGGGVTSCVEEGRRNLVVLDHACCGCGHQLKHQNIWHLMTRAFTVWFAMRVLNMTSADVFFTRRRPYGIVSTQLWMSVVGGGHVLKALPRTCARQLRVTPMSQSIHVWMSTRKTPVDRMWTLARHPRECSPQQQIVFRQFTQDIARGVGVSITRSRGADRCFLSRGASRDSRREINLDELKRSLPWLKVMHLSARMDLKEQIERVVTCRVIMGLHGAHMMHAMWLSPGTVVHEIHTISRTRNYYYRNVAILAGAQYTAHPICERGCVARKENGSTWLDPVRIERLLDQKKPPR